MSDEGANLTVVENGLQAVRMFQEKPEGYFDAILMDIMMPVIDGLTATNSIRSLNHPDAKKIPIEQNRCAMACQGCGAVLFLLKKQWNYFP